MTQQEYYNTLFSGIDICKKPFIEFFSLDGIAILPLKRPDDASLIDLRLSKAVTVGKKNSYLVDTHLTISTSVQNWIYLRGYSGKAPNLSGESIKIKPKTFSPGLDKRPLKVYLVNDSDKDITLVRGDFIGTFVCYTLKKIEWNREPCETRLINHVTFE